VITAASATATNNQVLHWQAEHDFDGTIKRHGIANFNTRAEHELRGRIAINTHGQRATKSGRTRGA